MINIKTLSAVALVTAALSSPVFAQDEAVAPKKPVHALHHYRTSYNQVQSPAFVAPRENGTYLENESYDRSRIGDHDPDINPAGN